MHVQFLHCVRTKNFKAYLPVVHNIRYHQLSLELLVSFADENTGIILRTARASEMQHFLNDFWTRSSEILFHTIEIHLATVDTRAFRVVPDGVKGKSLVASHFIHSRHLERLEVAGHIFRNHNNVTVSISQN